MNTPDPRPPGDPRPPESSRLTAAEAPREALSEGSRSLVIGILGGIASGKSLVAKRLAGPQGQVLAADSIAHEVLDSSEVRRLIVEHFGAAALDGEGRVDRAFLASEVFGPGSEKKRARLEGWTHPRVRARILERLEAAREQGVPRIVLDIPLLLENDAEHGFASVCDVLVFVEVDDDERERRARHFRGWSPGEVARREAAQLPLAQKRQRAGYVLSNQGSLEELDAQIERVLGELHSG